MKLIETKQDMNYDGISITTEGNLVPVTTVTLGSKSKPIFFEHNILLWRDTQVEIAPKILKGAGKRTFAGLPVMLLQAQGNGKIALSRDGAGQIIYLELQSGEQLDVREYQFLFATESVEYWYERVKGVSSLLLGGSGFFIDSFTGPGIIALHVYGNVFEKILQADEQIDVEAGAFLYKEASVKGEKVNLGVKTGLLAGSNVSLNRFTGPGKLGIQSMTFHLMSDPKGGGFGADFAF